MRQHLSSACCCTQGTSQVLYKGDNAPKVDYLILSVILVSLKTDIAGLEEDLKNGKEMTYN